VEGYGKARQATDDNIIWCMIFASWIKKVKKKTDSDLVILIAFHGKNDYAYAPNSYVLRTLLHQPVFRHIRGRGKVIAMHYKCRKNM
jgi:hypothetical protein